MDCLAFQGKKANEEWKDCQDWADQKDIPEIKAHREDQECKHLSIWKHMRLEATPAKSDWQAFPDCQAKWACQGWLDHQGQPAIPD